MDAIGDLKQAPINGDKQATERTVEQADQAKIRVLKASELSLVGGGTGAAQFF